MARKAKKPSEFSSAELRSVVGSPELEAIRMAAVLRARQEIYDEAQAVIAKHHTRERLVLRTSIISKMGFGGRAGPSQITGEAS